MVSNAIGLEVGCWKLLTNLWSCAKSAIITLKKHLYIRVVRYMFVS